jgi:hypothetical protein
MFWGLPVRKFSLFNWRTSLVVVAVFEQFDDPVQQIRSELWRCVMRLLSPVLIGVGLFLIAYSAWHVYRAGIDPKTLVEIQWLTPKLATVGQETPAPILFANRSGNAARIVGLNHC